MPKPKIVKTAFSRKFFLVTLAVFFFLVLLGISLTVAGFIHPSPNIILITADALRADHLSCYGYKRTTSPFLDNFAKNGFIFTEAVSHASHTPVSLGSISTGAYFLRHHLQGWGHTLNPSIPTLAETLKKKGYKTIFFGCHSHFKNLNGLGRGFDIFKSEDIPPEKVIKFIKNYLEEMVTKKTFLWIHYMGTHHPYFTTEEFLNIFLQDGFYDPKKMLPIVTDGPESYGYMGIPKSLAAMNNNIENPDFYIAQYDASIRFFDSQLNILFQELEKLKLYKNAVIIITADHGELLGEHDYYFHHGSFIFEPLIRVPLVIKMNNSLKGKVIRRQVEASVDIMPTILDMIHAKSNMKFDGSSLLPLMSGRGKNHKQIAIIDDYSKIAVRSAGWKLIRVEEGGRKSYSLYNLSSDPGESHNILAAEKEAFCLLKKELDGYLKLKSSYSIEPIKPLDEEAKEKLRLLGYAE